MVADRTIKVNITRQTTAVTRAGFGVALILGATVASVLGAGVLTKEYTDPSEMLDDGFLATDKEYLKAVAHVAQNPKVEKFKVGVFNPVATVKVLTFTGTLTTGTVSAEVNGTVYSAAFDTDQATTLTALAAAIQADSRVATAISDGTAITVTSEVSEEVSFGAIEISDLTSYAITVTSQTSNLGTNIAAILSQDVDWYDLLICSDAYDDGIALATVCATYERLSQFRVMDYQATVASSTTDIAYALNAAAYTRIAPIYTSQYANQIDAGIAGVCLPYSPGSITWKFKTIEGITFDPLSGSQISALTTKKCNYYVRDGGVNIFENGVVASGEYIDVIRGIDWFKARVKEAIFGTLVNSPKVPLTNIGIATIVGNIEAVIEEGIRVGLFKEDARNAVIAPSEDELSAADKIARFLTGLKVTVILAGAVHSVQVDATVTV